MKILFQENEQLKKEASRGASGLPPQLPRIVPAVDENTIAVSPYPFLTEYCYLRNTLLSDSESIGSSRHCLSKG